MRPQRDREDEAVETDREDEAVETREVAVDEDDDVVVGREEPPEEAEEPEAVEAEVDGRDLDLDEEDDAVVALDGELETGEGFIGKSKLHALTPLVTLDMRNCTLDAEEARVEAGREPRLVASSRGSPVARRRKGERGKPKRANRNVPPPCLAAPCERIRRFGAMRLWAFFSGASASFSGARAVSTLRSARRSTAWRGRRMR